MPHQHSTLHALAKQLLQTAKRHRHRRILLLSGQPDSCRKEASEIVDVLCREQLLWVGEATPAGIAPFGNQQANERLGGEVDLLIYDAFVGFDPDAFGALVGTLRGGGLLLLLTPPLDSWHLYPDAALERFLAAGFDTASVNGNFLRRLSSLLDADPWVIRCLDGRPLSQLKAETAPPLLLPEASGTCLTPDQQRAVAAIEHVAKGHRHRPLVLSSDRGRGKSSALGIAAASLMRDAPRRLLVTAPRRNAVNALFRQTTRQLQDAIWHGNDLHLESSRLGYSAPDHLLAERPPADLLLVDEAAAIPTALLEGLLASYPRVALATTVHGYEGTGRGFALRFKAHLDRETPQWREIRLETPIRWAADDPLEPLLFRMLGLDADPAPDSAVEAASQETVEAYQPDAAWLLQHEEALQQIFGLLVQAHYRTTPVDFRLLLDAPNLHCLLLRHGDAVAGVALLSREGEFEPELSREIWAGRRRPKGHLLAQSLAAHVGIPSAPGLKALRIMRIAIHPAARRRGLGSLLLSRIRDHARREGYDYFGTSFGVSENLFDFWHHNGLEPVRIGLRSGASSGDHSVLMLAPLSEAGKNLAVQASMRFARHLPALLEDPLRDLPAPLGARLLAASKFDGEADADDWSDLAGFAFAQRGYECCLPAIERLALLGLSRAELHREERELLILRVVQKRPWNECARLTGLSGRKQMETRLREIMARLYDQFADDAARRLLDGIR